MVKIYLADPEFITNIKLNINSNNKNNKRLCPLGSVYEVKCYKQQIVVVVAVSFGQNVTMDKSNAITRTIRCMLKDYLQNCIGLYRIHNTTVHLIFLKQIEIFSLFSAANFANCKYLSAAHWYIMVLLIKYLKKLY